MTYGPATLASSYLSLSSSPPSRDLLFPVPVVEANLVSLRSPSVPLIYGFTSSNIDHLNHHVLSVISPV